MKRVLIIIGVIGVAAAVAVAYPFSDNSSILSFTWPGRTLPQTSGVLALSDQAQLLGLYSGSLNPNPPGGPDDTQVNILYLRRLIKR